jgi:hypothetical protein
MFGHGEEDPLSDTALLRAVRQRLLEQVQAKHEAQALTNNIYNSPATGGHAGAGGVMGELGGGGGGVSPGGGNGEDPWDYMVDITRRDLPDINPHTGKPAGWEKTVRRHRTPKGHDKKKD